MSESNPPKSPLIVALDAYVAAKERMRAGRASVSAAREEEAAARAAGYDACANGSFSAAALDAVCAAHDRTYAAIVAGGGAEREFEAARKAARVQSELSRIRFHGRSRSKLMATLASLV